MHKINFLDISLQEYLAIAYGINYVLKTKNTKFVYIHNIQFVTMQSWLRLIFYFFKVSTIFVLSTFFLIEFGLELNLNCNTFESSSSSETNACSDD